MALRISEIFFSLQGEGPLIGYPTFFIRLYGCNLNCNWCDTSYAREGNNFTEKSWEEILKIWKTNYHQIPYVALTGGEPLLQEEIYNLISLFLKKGAILTLETNGSLSIAKVPPEVIILLDLKTPSSGMENFNLYENLMYLQKKDAIKFVIKNERDFRWSLDRIEEFNLLERVPCFFSPCSPYLAPEKLANWILETKKPIRFQIQIHKLLKLK